jgi:S1-C subfamily serine protease
MKINNILKKKINKCVVRILAEDININWNIPYLIKEPSKGQGTGFFIDNNGHILTCSHVVNGAKNLYIEIPSLGSDKYECEVIGLCNEFDIALIKCKTFKSKDCLELGDVENLKIGMEVMVVGYPASYTISSSNSNNLKFTIGIIKGQQRGLIETDSTTNPGNSGGPLFYKDKIIGINSMKLVGESLENIGYAIPINYYKIIKNLFEEKIIYRPRLLFDYNNTNKNLIKSLTNSSVDNGIIVSEIYDDSPFLNTNIKKDCIITSIDNFEIDNYGLIQNYKWLDTSINIDVLINKYKNNDTIKITYYNKDKKNECKIKLTPFIPPVRMIFPIFENIPYIIIGGMIFMNFTKNHLLNNQDKQLLKFYCISTDFKELLKPRLIISFIFPNTIVDKLNNVNENDFINKVNDIDVSNIDELKKALEKPIIINKKKYIKFEEEKGKSVIMLITDIIEQDILFSKIYNYPLNEFHKMYNKSINKIK